MKRHNHAFTLFQWARLSRNQSRSIVKTDLDLLELIKLSNITLSTPHTSTLRVPLDWN